MEHLTLKELRELAGVKTRVRWHPDYFLNVSSYNVAKDLFFVVWVRRCDEFWEVGLEHHNGGIQTRGINEEGCGSQSKVPMLIRADVAPEIDFTDKELKRLNSRHNATRCAKCNRPLKEPFQNVKHCPVCEP